MEEIQLKGKSLRETFSRFLSLKLYMEEFIIQDMEHNGEQYFYDKKKTDSTFQLIASFNEYDSELDSNFSQVKDLIIRMKDEIILDSIKESYYLGIEELQGIPYYLSLVRRDTLFYLFGLKILDEVFIDETTSIGDFLEKYYQLNNTAYICWQDDKGIIAASPQFLSLSKIENDSFFLSIQDVNYRDYQYMGTNLFEVVLPFFVFQEQSGFLRIGYYLNLYHEEIKEARLILFLFFFIFFSISIFFYYSFWHRQKYKILQNEYYNLSNYTGHIINSIKDGIVVLDKNLNPVLYNPAFMKFFSDIEKISFEWIKEHFGESVNHQEKSLKNLIYKEEKQGEINIRNGRYTVLYQIVPFQDSSLNEQWIILLKDITRYKELENKARNEERMSLLGKVSSMVAHEIRNPLNSIAMIIQRIKTEFIPMENKQDYERLNHIVEEEIKRLNSIVTKFLEYGRLPAPDYSVFSWLELINEIYELTKYWGSEKKFRLQFNELDIMMNADRNQLKQSLLNLISNSFHALPDNGSGLIKLETVISGEKLLVNIEDNGTGIPELNREKIFDLYFSTKNDGSGFGLPITKRIIEEHGGEMNLIKSSPEGTVFTISLPIEGVLNDI